MSHKFLVVEDKTKPHWLELVGSFPGDEDKDVWLSIVAKWDGCVYFTRHANVPANLREPGKDNDADEFIHICDIDEMIEDLQEIRRIARGFFKEKEAWKPAIPLPTTTG